ncbi:hypothetical protein EDB80DRAFT_399675 [Ilyonectria destructans]|nr:hypothetical protein EDB80DRAFT_399675 [Ilyonectria destructans]
MNEIEKKYSRLHFSPLSIRPSTPPLSGLLTTTSRGQSVARLASVDRYGLVVSRHIPILLALAGLGFIRADVAPTLVIGWTRLCLTRMGAISARMKLKTARRRMKLGRKRLEFWWVRLNSTSPFASLVSASSSLDSLFFTTPMASISSVDDLASIPTWFSSVFTSLGGPSRGGPSRNWSWSSGGFRSARGCNSSGGFDSPGGLFSGKLSSEDVPVQVVIVSSTTLSGLGLCFRFVVFCRRAIRGSPAANAIKAIALDPLDSFFDSFSFFDLLCSFDFFLFIDALILSKYILSLSAQALCRSFLSFFPFASASLSPSNLPFTKDSISWCRSILLRFEFMMGTGLGGRLPLQRQLPLQRVWPS